MTLHTEDRSSDLLSLLYGILQESPTGLSLFRRALMNGWQIDFSDLDGTGLLVDVCSGTLLLDHFNKPFGTSLYTKITQNEILLNMVRGLRELWHEDCQKEEINETYKPDDILLLERVRRADCETVALQVGWELRSGGFYDLWQAFLSSDLSDMATCYARTYEMGGAHPSRTAMAQSFQQWYKNEKRLFDVDQNTLEWMDECLQEGNLFGSHSISSNSSTIVEEMTRLPLIDKDTGSYLFSLLGGFSKNPLFHRFRNPLHAGHLIQIYEDWQRNVLVPLKQSACLQIQKRKTLEGKTEDIYTVSGVSFRDRALAERIFPGSGFSGRDSENPDFQDRKHGLDCGHEQNCKNGRYRSSYNPQQKPDHP